MKLIDELSPFIAKWMGQSISDEKKRAAGIADFEKWARRTLSEATRDGYIQVLRLKKKPIAVWIFMKPIARRVKGERVLFFEYDSKCRAQALPWIKARVLKEGTAAPLNTRMGSSPEDSSVFDKIARRAGFNIRYEILLGETAKALKNLIKAKNPPLDLKHLGIEFRVLKTKAEVEAANKVQKRVFSQVPQHGNFSHTKIQLAKDKKEFLEMIQTGRGKILGFYRKNKLMGFMAGFVPTDKRSYAGITICLDPKIQGLGITKTGYRILLQYFVDNKINTFQGGTSQPAVKKLAEIMERKVDAVIYVKGTWKN